MKRACALILGTGMTLLANFVWAATPVIANVLVSQRSGTKLVDVYYNLTDADGLSSTVWINVSGDGGQSWTIPSGSLSGDAGAGIAPGTGKHLVWNAGQDWNGQLVPNCKVRVFANDGTTPIPPAGMAYIPAGLFQMGDTFNEVGNDALPLHNVQVDGFFMDINDVSGTLWLAVRQYAIESGYTDLPAGSYPAATHPVHKVNWYDAVKWCNARSEKESLTPAYYTDATLSQVYRTGSLDISNACVNWSANGYRLPTEAEREKAARGGMLGWRYPWGNTIGGSNANYLGSGDPFEGNNPATTPCGYYNGSQIPAGPDMANGYGLYDMAGNVWQWCWDWYDSAYYGRPEAANNPRGATTGSSRVLRGGTWYNPLDVTRCAVRCGYGPGVSIDNGYGYGGVGFGLRCVRGH
jgi:formylglycine-generating enzyme required for sulfatase activity